MGQLRFKKVLITILVVCFSVPIQTFACPKNVQNIKKGQEANCDGFLFSPETEQKARQATDDVKFYKELNLRLEQRKELTDKEISILDKRLQLYINQSNHLTEEVLRKRNEDKWQKFMWFGLGVLATGISFYGVSQIR